MTRGQDRTIEIRLINQRPYCGAEFGGGAPGGNDEKIAARGLACDIGHAFPLEAYKLLLSTYSQAECRRNAAFRHLGSLASCTIANHADDA
jgi:hypothetical protein